MGSGGSGCGTFITSVSNITNGDISRLRYGGGYSVAKDPESEYMCTCTTQGGSSTNGNASHATYWNVGDLVWYVSSGSHYEAKITAISYGNAGMGSETYTAAYYDGSCQLTSSADYADFSDVDPGLAPNTTDPTVTYGCPSS